MNIQRSGRQPTRIIDHEPLEQPQSGTVFGKRRPAGAKPAVTRDFFNTPPNTSFRSAHKGVADIEPYKDEAVDGFTFSRMASLLPVKVLAAVVVIAVILPVAIISVSEQLFNSGIDPMTTASIASSNGLEISDVSLSRVIRQDTSVATIFGQVSNPHDNGKPLGPLVISLYDSEGKLVQSWQHRIGQASIGSGQVFRFMTSAIDYSGEAHTVRVSMAPTHHDQ